MGQHLQRLRPAKASVVCASRQANRRAQQAGGKQQRTCLASCPRVRCVLAAAAAVRQQEARTMPYATQTATKRKIVLVPLTYSDSAGPPAGGCTTSSINT